MVHLVQLEQQAVLATLDQQAPQVKRGRKENEDWMVTLETKEPRGLLVLQ